MKKIWLVSAALCILHTTYSQKNILISKVEERLVPSTQIADSSFEHFNILDRMKFYGVNAVSVAVIDSGKLQWANAYGYADEAEKKKADTNTLFLAASITKSFNALCIFRLAAQKKLSLDVDIHHYLKTWKLPENEFSKNNKITLLQLLSHTAGLNNDGFGAYFERDSIPTLDDQLNGLPPAKNKKVELIAKPGTKYMYSNAGPLITQKILQDNVNQDYGALITNTVIRPLRLHHSSIQTKLPDSLKALAATAYSDGELPGRYPVSPALAAGSLWTTPGDLAKFVTAIQKMYSGKSSLLTQSLSNKMLRPAIDTADYQLSYIRAKLSPGFFLMERGGETYFFHSGGAEGYSSIFYGGLKNGKGAVVMVNSNNTQILFEIVNAIATAYNWKEFYQPELKATVNVADSLLLSYDGEYIFKNIDITFLVKKNANALYLKSKTGSDPFADISEKMYASTINKFFLLSNKLEFKFTSSSPGGKIDLMYIKNGDAILKGERK